MSVTDFGALQVERDAMMIRRLVTGELNALSGYWQAHALASQMSIDL